MTTSQRTEEPCEGKLSRTVLKASGEGDLSRLASGLRSGTLTCDHVVPVSRGGSSTLDNLVTACLACNLAKSTMTPKEWRAQQRQRKQGR
jgi:5-methylcytosine-specific restriction endonuclease McrA